MKITSSEPKYYLGRSWEGVDYLSEYQDYWKVTEKKASYSITNVSLKDISNIIKEFDRLPYEGYVQKRTKCEPIDN